ncbi:hypothetical protein ATY81_21625 [Rhizobium sp. R72]|nr:hypothetical protein ATY81_21625 [Rhizobium sp. R72]OWW02817.1 hypothetical protein ATY80_21625 [Rhizobium sp. R711]
MPRSPPYQALQDALARIGGQGEIAQFIRLGPCMETRMAIVVALADRLSQTRRRKGKNLVEAQILLFTGVRYERLTESSKRSSGHRVSRAKK